MILNRSSWLSQRVLIPKEHDACCSDLLDTDPMLRVKIKISFSQNQTTFSSFFCPDLESHYKPLCLTTGRVEKKPQMCPAGEGSALDRWVRCSQRLLQSPNLEKGSEYWLSWLCLSLFVASWMPSSSFSSSHSFPAHTPCRAYSCFSSRPSNLSSAFWARMSVSLKHRSKVSAKTCNLRSCWQETQEKDLETWRVQWD